MMTHLSQLFTRFIGALESSVDDIDTVCGRIGDVLFHEAAETGQICCHAWYTHDRTFGFEMKKKIQLKTILNLNHLKTKNQILNIPNLSITQNLIFNIKFSKVA